MKKTNEKNLIVAAVQMISKVGAIEENLNHAYDLLQTALERGAQMVIFPELMPSGYTLAEKIWQGAEPSNGLTARWLRDTAAQFGD